MKTEFDQLRINKLVNVSIGLNNLKVKEEDLDYDHLSIFSVNLKKFSDAMSKEVVKKTL